MQVKGADADQFLQKMMKQCLPSGPTSATLCSSQVQAEIEDDDDEEAPRKKKRKKKKAAVAASSVGVASPISSLGG